MTFCHRAQEKSIYLAHLFCILELLAAGARKDPLKGHDPITFTVGLSIVRQILNVHLGETALVLIQARAGVRPDPFVTEDLSSCGGICLL